MSEEQICKAKILIRMLILPPLPRSAPMSLLVFLIVLISGSLISAKKAAPTDEEVRNEIENVTVLAPFIVKGVRVEDFGFRVCLQVVIGIAIPGTSYAMVSEVFPNTAADKAGLRPGELISEIDGKSMSKLSMAIKLPKMQDRKWAELETGKKSVTYSLEVRAPGTKLSRTVTMVIPSPAPHWGSEKWNTPAGRTPAVVPEAGPLAALAREVMDNGIFGQASRTNHFLGQPHATRFPFSAMPGTSSLRQASIAFG